MATDNDPSEETKNRWHNDPNNWVWGVFYYNTEDKRLLPPKRTKQMGWTINFANPNSVMIVIIIIAILIIIGESTK